MPRIRPEFETGSRGALMSLATAGRLLTRAGVVGGADGGAARARHVSPRTRGRTLGQHRTRFGHRGDGRPLATGGGVGWLHVAVLGVLAGTWLLGAGLVVTGLAGFSRPRRPVWTHRPAAGRVTVDIRALAIRVEGRLRARRQSAGGTG